MNNLADSLFLMCCKQELNPPQEFMKFSLLREFYDCLSREDKRRFMTAMDAYEWELFCYSRACFEQGIRFAFSLTERLYPRAEE